MRYPQIAFLTAVVPLLLLMVLLYYNVSFFGDGTLGGPNQIALIIAAMVAVLLAIVQGIEWHVLYEGMLKSINSSLGAMLILLLIGGLSGVWMVSGIVPTMIYYGLKIISPSFFLVAACVVCCIVSVATGSSWSTVATVGIALLGIGKAMGFSDGIIAGAIISGAYFGDKISPLSDTTNLAPAMAGTDLFTHIRYMMYTTVPSISIALLLFFIIGLNYSAEQNELFSVQELEQVIREKFWISPVLLLVPAAVIVMIVKKIPAFPALFIGIVLGAVAAFSQPAILLELSGSDVFTFQTVYKALINAVSSDTQIVTSNEVVTHLLSTRGMAGMLGTIWLIVCAMIFGGVMEASGFLVIITEKIIRFATTTFSLFFSTVLSCIFFNGVAADQYLAIVVPGRMFAPVYRQRKLKPENLSRTLEDAGTVTSVLFPWNTCGATQASVLGVATGTYWIYCFFNLISPLMTLTFALFNIRIRYEEETGYPKKSE